VVSLPLLEVDSLTVDYRTRGGDIRAVNNLSFVLEKGETLGLVGESGSGKSTLGLSIIRLVPVPGAIVNGHVRIDGVDIVRQSDEEMRAIRAKKVAYTHS
jgi:ABC-type glutathione transport system ATPase component